MQKPMLYLTAGLLMAWQPFAHAAVATNCTGQQINKTFASGASWNLCWTVRPAEGVVLSQVSYKAPNQAARRVLGEASLSQLQVDADDAATAPAFINTDKGLGNTLLTLTNADCTGGTLYASNGRNVLCGVVRSHGYLYKYTTQRQGQFWDLASQSQVGSRNYSVRWRLYENGTIEPSLGVSGQLPVVNATVAQYGWPAMATGKVATGFTAHALWRLDFDLDTTNGNDVIEEFNSTPSADRLTKVKSMTVLGTETARLQNIETKRWWRVRDSLIGNGGVGTISYEIVPNDYDQSRANSNNQTWLASDVFFTRYKDCEKQAARNAITNGCASDVSQFVNNESINSQDVVVWYKQSYHHLPRSEDSNRIATQWSSFQLLPRDWHARNPC